MSLAESCGNANQPVAASGVLEEFPLPRMWVPAGMEAKSHCGCHRALESSCAGKWPALGFMGTKLNYQ